MKKIRILTAIICICVITACSQQRDNSTRVKAIEQIAHAEENVEIDPRKRVDRILYSTENNTERIVGYSDGAVFLYCEDRLIKRNVETNETEICLEGLPRENSKLFVWRGNYLIVFDMDDCVIVGQGGI